MKGKARGQREHRVAQEQVHLRERKNDEGLREEDGRNRDVWATYKVQVCVVDWSLLPAKVGEDEERVDEVAGKAHAGQRNPDTQGHEGLEKACKKPQVSVNDSLCSSSICLRCTVYLHNHPFSNVTCPHLDFSAERLCYSSPGSMATKYKAKTHKFTVPAFKQHLIMNSSTYVEEFILRPYQPLI